MSRGTVVPVPKRCAVRQQQGIVFAVFMSSIQAAQRQQQTREQHPPGRRCALATAQPMQIRHMPGARAATGAAEQDSACKLSPLHTVKSA